MSVQAFGDRLAGNMNAMKHRCGGVIQVVVTGASDGAFFLAQDNDRVAKTEGKHPKPDGSVSLDSTTLADIDENRADLRDPKFIARLSVEGDLQLIGSLVFFLRDASEAQRAYDLAKKKTPNLIDFQIERIQRPSTSVVRDAIAASRPIIVTGAFDDAPARRLTPESLRQQYGQVNVAIVDGKAITLAEYVDRILANDALLGTGGMILPPAIVRALPPPDHLCVDKLRRPLMWIGAKGAITSLHRDATDGLAMQIFGEKEWTIFSPAQDDYLYPSTLSRGFQSCLVDPYHPNLDKFPLFAKAKPTVFTIRPGEILVTPTGWFHHVRLLEPTLSVTYALSI